MPTAKVHNLKNKEVGDVILSDAVFDVELNEPLIHSAIRNFLANARQGTSATKTRGNVRGGGKKPWKQKGTGRARVASIRSPLWRGGGRVHGPQPKDWSYKMPKKMRRGAMRSALSERLREGNIIIIDDFKIDNPKTKDFISVMADLGFENVKKQTKVLIVDSLENENLILSSRNVKRTKVTNGYGVNIYDLIYHEKLLISKTALKELTELLDPARSKGVDNSGEVKEEKPKKKAKVAEKETEKVAEEKSEAKKEVKPKKEKVEKEETKETKKKVEKEEPKVEEAKAEESSTITEESNENEEAANDE
jgi:large subunit ribosomal protein L4